MSDDATRRRFLALTGSTAAIAVAGCSSNDSSSGTPTNEPATDTPTDTPTATDDETSTPTTQSGPVTFTVRIENTAPTDFYGSDTATGGAIWLTPGAYAVYEGENPLFTQGEAASIGLEAQAEAGPPTGFEGQPGLVDELPENDNVISAGAYAPGNTVKDPNDPKDAVPGAPPIAPGGAYEFEVEAEAGQLLNFASMFVPSNDIFISSPSGIELFNGDKPASGEVDTEFALWDAGTELNGQPGVDPTSAPLQKQNGGANAGTTEGVVQPLSSVNDGFNYADPSDIIDVVLTPEGDGTFTVRIENTAPTDFYGSDTATGGAIWITPGAYAVHSGSNPIFERGQSASIGLEAQAEAGPPTGFEGQPGLVDELPQSNNVASAGAYGPGNTVEDPNDPKSEVPGAPPIAPGGAFEFTIESSPGDRFSFASMYVPSNDVFISPKPAIDLYDDNGNPVSGSVANTVGLWDAGTELNGQPGVDPTSAPLQKQNGGANAGSTEGVVHALEDVNDPYQYPDANEIISVTLMPSMDG